MKLKQQKVNKYREVKGYEKFHWIGLTVNPSLQRNGLCNLRPDL